MKLFALRDQTAVVKPGSVNTTYHPGSMVNLEAMISLRLMGSDVGDLELVNGEVLPLSKGDTKRLQELVGSIPA